MLSVASGASAVSFALLMLLVLESSGGPEKVPEEEALPVAGSKKA